ncbi:MAG: hypothetical protein GFGODING_01404 [Flavobacteriales bacterium]|nr:hypothetical protein [Flavobacteriales bacterium]
MRSSAHSFRSQRAERRPGNHIALRKPGYAVGPGLSGYLERHGRSDRIPIAYEDLLRHDGLMAHHDANGRETLWTTVLLRPAEMEDTHRRLVELYRMLTGDGRPLPHLAVAGIDFCGFGNSQPFRVKILNQLNDNHDYFYIKKADASRVYGLELEHLLSPNKINYIHSAGTLVEEHIIGIPGDDFIKDPGRYGGHLNPVRLCKEFVKFNERCFVRLLGDMRAYNFVVDVVQDFDQVQYRLRSIDFDQQCFEGRHRIYLPQFYKENLPFVALARTHIGPATAEQYAEEERSLLRKRYQVGAEQVEALLEVMHTEVISLPEHVALLRSELAAYHGCPDFKRCTTMGAVLQLQLKVMLGL